MVLLSGISWMVVYGFAIVRGFADKTYAIPLPAILANLAWEFLYGTVFRNQSPAGPYIPIIWLALDIVIFFQALRYWQREFPSLDKTVFTLLIMAGLATCMGILYSSEIENLEYFRSAFPQNLMMSVLFLQMLFVRDDARGQSLYIALFKFLGTASVIVLEAYPISEMPKLDASICVGILLFDTLYFVLLYKKLSRLGIKPWHRL